MESKFKIGAPVVVNMGIAGFFSGFIHAVKFSESKVYYDVKVFPFIDEPENKSLSIIFSGIDSYYIECGLSRFLKPTNNGYNTESNMGLKLCNN